MVDWLTIAERAKEIAGDFYQNYGPPTLRSIFYVLTSEGMLPLTNKGYKRLSKVITRARLEEIIPWKWIADETRVIIGGDNEHSEPVEYADNIYWNLAKQVGDYCFPRWADQDCYIEVWLEKHALARVFSSWLKEKAVSLVLSRGYSSWTFLRKAADRLEDHSERELIILYFGDFDPSGVDIERFVKDALEQLGVEVEVQRLAVTKDQIERFNLPHKPEDADEIAKLKRDPRFKKWPYGLYRVELDALFAREPEFLGEILTQKIDEYFDEEIYQDILEREKEAKIQMEKELIPKLRFLAKFLEDSHNYELSP